MATFLEYDAELETALIDITGGARRVSDDLRRDRVPDGGNSFQLRQSAVPPTTIDGNTQEHVHGTTIVVYHYLDRDPVELEREYTLVAMQAMQEALLYPQMYIDGPNRPTSALTTVQEFGDGGALPVIPITFARVGRVISFEVEVAIHLKQ